MTRAWGSLPRFKIEVGTTTYENDTALSIKVVRPENKNSYAVLMVDDYKSSKYEAIFDAFTTLDVSFRYGSGNWTKVFSGQINNASPKLSNKGETLEVSAWGNELGIAKTHNNTSYGTESANPTLNLPQEILVDIITNYVDKAFNGASTQWGLGTGKIENVHNGCSITHLSGSYLDNQTLMNKLLDLVNAYAQGLGQVGVHWFVNTDKNVYVKKIDTDSADGVWTQYWDGSQANATLEVTKDMILYDFRKNIDDYANKVLLASAFRKPAYDIWTEDGGPVWGVSSLTATYTNAQYVVGSHSMLLEPTGPPGLWSYAMPPYNLALDFTKCGTQNSIPHLNFYWRANVLGAFNSNILLWTDLALFGGAHADAYFQLLPYDIMKPVFDKWVHFSVPVGPYWALDPSLQKEDGTTQFEYTTVGAASWSNISGIAFLLANDATYDVYIDDLHFNGQIIREAIDTSEITATKKEHQILIRSDNALDDTCNISSDTGTAARLCYSELCKRSQTPIVGIIQVPQAETLLPGQTIHAHACQKADGTFRINADMRAKEITHFISSEGSITTANLTSDVTNSNTFGVPSAYKLLLEQAYGLTHGQAKDLKSSGIDPLLTRLTVSY